MKGLTGVVAAIITVIFLSSVCPKPVLANGPKELAEQNSLLLQQIQQVHGLTAQQLAGVSAIFAASGYIGQGNPTRTNHPVSEADCRKKLAQDSMLVENSAFSKICGAKFMAPLYNPATEGPAAARVCIDQFEFPNIPCTYPVVWVRAREAAEICTAMGKRLCDAHEWEGACAGALLPPDYNFELGKGDSPGAVIHTRRLAHNRANEASKSWSYGKEYRRGICAASSHKDNGCNGGDWSRCGSNTFPSGYFSSCHSSLGVYDLNGNAAEHMNLPLNESQMSSRGSKELGYTEMKGSWFIFDTYHAHEDWCRWRAPYWHGSRVMDLKSHENYHLGFRCCKTITP